MQPPPLPSTASRNCRRSRRLRGSATSPQDVAAANLATSGQNRSGTKGSPNSGQVCPKNKSELSVCDVRCGVEQIYRTERTLYNGTRTNHKYLGACGRSDLEVCTDRKSVSAWVQHTHSRCDPDDSRRPRHDTLRYRLCDFRISQSSCSARRWCITSRYPG